MTGVPLITLLTDFGLRDPFVGAMKGVIAGISPAAHVVDITHSVEPQNIIQGGLLWRQAVPFFPEGTIHVAVVDPGVGGPREIVAVRGPKAVFLAPDNGILGFVVEEEEIQEAVFVHHSRYFLPVVSRTFHGRDIFAPVAAHVSRGLPLRRLGPPATALRRSSVPEPVRSRIEGRKGREKIAGKILDVDHFGNGVTNIRLGEPERVLEVRVGRHRLPGLSSFYGEVPAGRGLALIGSSGFLEIAVREGRADSALGIRSGRKVTVILRAPGEAVVRGRDSTAGGRKSEAKREKKDEK